MGWLKRISGVLGMIAVFALIDGGLGSVIPLLTNDISSDSKSLNMLLYDTGIFDKTSSYIIASLIWDLADKFISVLLAIIILRAIPEKFYRRTQLC